MLHRIDVLTLFPDLVEHFLGEALVGSARQKGLLDLNAHDLRDWTSDRRRTVDDTPYGGGPGMLMKPEPLVAGIEALAGPKGPERAARVILMSPQGRVLDQALLGELAETPHLVLVCGRYEGVDQRVIDLAVDDEVSIGDYVLLGGEVPAMALVEGLARLVPGVLGNPASTQEDSFGGGLLEGPQYTRPPTFGGLGVPEVLLSGNHAQIARWRAEQSQHLTRQRRPDLIGLGARGLRPEDGGEAEKRRGKKEED